MFTDSTPQATGIGRNLTKLFDYVVQYAFEIFLLVLILYICIARGLSFSIDLYDPLPPSHEPQSSELSFGAVLSSLGELSVGTSSLFATDLKTEERSIGQSTVAIQTTHQGFNEVAFTNDPAPHISNLTLVLSPDYGERKGLAKEVIAAKKGRVRSYLNRYAEAARAEMKEFGIPASITLAQGLLESNAGDSKLARVSNNHFGIKCRAKCLGCTCRNYGDDTRYDMFRVFNSPAESFREHSELLQGSRYKRLKGYGMDYKKWAHGLRACGYATDKKYGHKLVTIIENLGLDRFDSL